MHAFPLTPSPDTASALPRADFSDAFGIDVGEAGLDAPEAARRAFERMPKWAAALLAVRNCVVAPFGLKNGRENSTAASRGGALFPVISSSPQRMVLGFDDAHLDFRIVVDVANITASHRRVIATTLVRQKNIFGRAYLTAIMPFHKIIVPAMLGQITK